MTEKIVDLKAIRAKQDAETVSKGKYESLMTAPLIHDKSLADFVKKFHTRESIELGVLAVVEMACEAYMNEVRKQQS